MMIIGKDTKISQPSAQRLSNLVSQGLKNRLRKKKKGSGHHMIVIKELAKENRAVNWH